jgi:hypothetical protein
VVWPGSDGDNAGPWLHAAHLAELRQTIRKSYLSSARAPFLHLQSPSAVGSTILHAGSHSKAPAAAASLLVSCCRNMPCLLKELLVASSFASCLQSSSSLDHRPYLASCLFGVCLPPTSNTQRPGWSFSFESGRGRKHEPS